MDTFVYALMDGPPFAQWRDVGGGDLLYLAPWILLIWLLIPKGGESRTPRVPWRTVLLSALSVVVLAFLALVVYYALSGA